MRVRRYFREIKTCLPSTIDHPYHIPLQRNIIPFPQHHSRECTSLYLNTNQGRLAQSTSVHKKKYILINLYFLNFFLN